MARRSDIEKDLQAMITRGGMPDSMRIANALSTIPAALEKRKQNKAIQASRDLTTISGFEARIGNKVSNYMASGDIYDESKITALKDSVNSLYDQHSSKFPELIAEFSDERDSALGIINNYSTKNKQKDLLLSKIEPTKDRLYNIAKTLGETTTADLSPDDRVKFRQEVRSAMEDVVTLDKLIEDPYYSGIEGWADVAEDVKYGISDASKQLLTQINTWQKATEGDPSSMYVINEAELGSLESAIFKNDASGIRAINEQISTDKKSRMEHYEKDYFKSLKEYETINSFYSSNAFQKTLSDKNEAYDKASEEEKKRIDRDPEYWRVYNIDVPGLPEEGVDITQDVHIPLLRAKARATNIDADYRNEHITGSSIAEILNKPLPWVKGKTSLEQKRIEHEKRVSDLGLTVPSVGGGETVVTEGDEPFAVSELHKPVTPTEPTMPTGEPRAFSEMNNPGNLRFADQKDSTGKTAAGFATFGTPDAGWQALYNQIDLDKTRDFTLEEFTNKYAPPSENDTTAYIASLQKQLKVNKSTKIEDINTKKLANAIAKQEGWKGEFPSVETKTKGLKVDSPLTKVKDNKVVVNYSSASSTGFKKQQTNLNKIASQKYNTKENKNKYSNVKDFVKSKFEEWLRSTGKYGKYAEGDFKYFIPTKVDRKNQVSSNPDMNRYNLYYPGAFSGAEGDVRMMIKPKIGSGYLGFAKDFDEFREFLQES